MKLTAAFALFLAAFVLPVGAQTYDTSGNGMLNGTYYFRHVTYVVSDNNGNLGEAVALYGNITFSGTGTYTIDAVIYDSSVGVQQPYTTPGTYVIGANGLGYLDNPVTGDRIFGLVSQGIFIGSSTENTYVFNDLFIAAPLASPQPTNATFKGTYSAVAFDVFDGAPADFRDAFFQMNADGAGHLGTVSLRGYIGGVGSTVVNQSLSNVTYAFSNGGANVSLGGTATLSTTLLNGTQYLYFSPDGNFVFGGSPTAWDMIIGVRVNPSSSAPALSGTYYQAGVVEDLTTVDFDSFYGAINANSGTIIGHERRLSPFVGTPYDFTFDSTYSLASDGSYDDSSLSQHYLVGPGGLVRIGMGTPPFLGVNVSVQAPAFSGPAPFINPIGIVNAASSAPFTVGVSGGEFITIYGSGMASKTTFASDVPFPPTLGGVQVLINGVAAPIYYVSSTQISVIVPFATAVGTAQVQVVNNNVPSNTVTTFVNLTTPGVFSEPSGGVGLAAALHADYSLVTEQNPAQIGETVQVFVTGLGTVTPTISDGAAGVFSQTTNTIQVFIDGQPATTSYVGLAPQLAGLYQINVAVPSGVNTGDVFLDVSGPDSYNSEALLPIAGGASNALPHRAARPTTRRQIEGTRIPLLKSAREAQSSEQGLPTPLPRR